MFYERLKHSKKTIILKLIDFLPHIKIILYLITIILSQLYCYTIQLNITLLYDYTNI